MGIGIDGSKPIGALKSAKRALCIVEHEAREAAKRQDTNSATNLRAVVTFLSGIVFDDMREVIKNIPLISLDCLSWDAGFIDGEKGKPHNVPAGVDGLSYASGFIEGKAKRQKTLEVTK